MLCPGCGEKASVILDEDCVTDDIGVTYTCRKTVRDAKARKGWPTGLTDQQANQMRFHGLLPSDYTSVDAAMRALARAEKYGPTPKNVSAGCATEGGSSGTSGPAGTPGS